MGYSILEVILIVSNVIFGDVDGHSLLIVTDNTRSSTPHHPHVAWLSSITEYLPNEEFVVFRDPGPFQVIKEGKGPDRRNPLSTLSLDHGETD